MTVNKKNNDYNFPAEEIRKEIKNKDMNKQKILNCARCGTNPWKQGCYALWGKSPEALLYKKGEDNGYICSVCAFKISIRNNNFAFAERYNQCPVYGSKNIGKKYFTTFTVTNPITDETTRFKAGASFKFSEDYERFVEKDDPDLAEKIAKAIFDDDKKS